MGYETYITWYKWDENNYAENRIIGIVRNIKKYILEVKELLIDEQWDEIALRCAAPELQETIPYRDVRDLARHFFISSALELRNGNQDITQHRIKDVIFPEILENPFQRDPEGRYVFPLRVRVIAESGEYIYISRIQMNENPFERQQFYFQHMSEDVHN